MLGAYNDRKMDRLFSATYVTFVVGIVIVAAPNNPERFGLWTGLMLIAFGIFAFALRGWRNDPGLWMLAALVLAIYGPCYIYWQTKEFLSIIDGVRGQQDEALSLKRLLKIVDSCLATYLFGVMLGFLWTVVTTNRRISR